MHLPSAANFPRPRSSARTKPSPHNAPVEALKTRPVRHSQWRGSRGRTVGFVFVAAAFRCGLFRVSLQVGLSLASLFFVSGGFLGFSFFNGFVASSADSLRLYCSPNKSGLCFSGLFRLSGITFVFAGTPATLRASRRASTPLSSFFFRPRFISTLLPGDLAHRAPPLVDRLVCIRKGPGIGIRNVNRAKRLPTDFVRSFARRPHRIVKRVVFIRIAMRPSVHRDRLNIPLRVKSSSPQRPPQLIPYILFKSSKRCGHQLRSTGALLLPSRRPGPHWNMLHMHQARLIRRLRKPIPSHAHGKIQFCSVKKPARKLNAVHLQPFERPPVSQLHVAVNQWHLHVVG